MKDVIRYLAPVVACAILALPRIADAQSPTQIPPSITTPDKVDSRLGTLEFKDGAPSKATLDKVYDNLDFTYAFRAFTDNMRGVSIHAARKGLQSIGVSRAVLAALALICTATSIHAQSPARSTVPVTADNFTRAETDTYFANIVEQAGGPGKFFHRREIEPIDNQIVIRGNRDTVYSAAVFDLDAGPVTVTLPDAGGRFMSMIVIDEDQYTPAVYYGAGSHTFTRQQIGTRYLMLALRTFVDPNNPADLKTVHVLQDAVKVSQQGTGSFEIPNWDPVSHKRVRDALLVLYATVPDQNRMFGTKEQVDPIRRLIGSAGGWGRNPDSEAKYLNVNPSRHDGKTVYKLTVGSDVPVDGFWSITVYDADGRFQKNEYDAYSVNNITAKKGESSSVTVQFGGCNGKTANCLPTMSGWNYMVRLYRPRAEILNGTWKFPEAQAVN